MSILIKNILLNNKPTNILIENNKISQIDYKGEADHIIEGKNKAIIPGLINCHTHAAMTLLRGYADDIPLQEWLETKIWPTEAKLTEKDIYTGTKLACLEMIKSGTTCFNDMYHKILPIAKAIKETGIRAFPSEVYFDTFIENFTERKRELINNIKKVKELNCSRITPVLGPHAIYTVSKDTLQWTKETADKNNLKIHIHLSETEQEVKDCIKQHEKRPVEYLNDIGFLGENIIAAHCIWVNQNEIKLLKESKVKVSYNPVSNMKLSVGKHFPYREMIQNNITFGIGTDGASSNNNLDMFESMKFASLLQKHSEASPIIANAKEIFSTATLNGSKVLGLNAGKIQEGYLADLILIDLKKAHLTPNHNLISNLAYSTNGSCVSDVIIDGRIVMRDRKVKGEEEILQEAEECIEDLKPE